MIEQTINYAALALQKIAPGAQWTITDGMDIHWVKTGNTYVAENFIWHDDPSTRPTKEQIDEAIESVKLEIKSEEYKRKRYREYPSIGDQLDALFKAGIFPEEMAAQIQAVKDKYPKG